MKDISNEILKEYELKRKINKILYEIRMQTTCIGFCYWLNAIDYCVSKGINESYYIRTISEVYLYIAKKYKTSVDCVEKSMRYAKEKSDYKEQWRLDSKLKNHEFLQMSIDKTYESLFHK